MNIDDIARICHEAHRGYCLSIGDDSQAMWPSVPDWQRQSTIAGVKFHVERLRTPGESHESWLASRKADGWVYGEKKDPIKKTHPCFVPFEELPEDQQVKDHIFTAICKSMRPFFEWKDQEEQI